MLLWSVPILLKGTWKILALSKKSTHSKKKGKIRRKTPWVQEQKKPKHKKKLQKMFGVCVAAPCFRDPAKLLERIWARDANGDTDRLQYTGGVSHEEPKGTMG